MQRMQSKISKVSTCMVAALLVAPVSAVDLNWRASVGTDFSDNGRRTAEDPISERQDRLGLNISAGDALPYAQYNLAYNWGYTSFSEGSQEDRSLVDGGSSLTLGRRQGLLQLQVDHNRRISLIDPRDQNINSNLDERSILTVGPRLNLPVSSVDLVTVSYDESAITYNTDSSRDSKRKSASVSYRHRVSEVDNLSLRYTSQKISYLEIEDYEYSYSRVNLGYEAQLRNLTYDLSVGYNEVDQDETQVGDTTFGLDLEYALTGFTIGVSALREITDNSLREGAEGPRVSGVAEGDVAEGNVTSGEPSGAGSGFNGSDQYQRKLAVISLQAQNVCARCTLDFSFSREQEVYRTLSINDSVEDILRASFRYRLSDRSSLGIQSRMREQVFEDESVGTVESMEYSLDYRKQIVQRMDFVMSLTHLSQESALRARSEENRLGLGFSYQY